MSKCHMEEADHLFRSGSSICCGAGLITARYVDDRVGEMFGLRTALGCQALSKRA